jgi:non-ribosomal peptide synthetase component F
MIFAKLVDRISDQPAVDDSTMRLTYGELFEQSQALGARIAATVPPDGIVGVALPNSAFYPLAWLACLAARRAFLPLDPHAPAARNQAIAAAAGLAANIVATDDVAIGGTPQIAIVQTAGAQPPALPLDLPAARIGLVVATSGSTGQPKCIALHERSILRKSAYYRQTVGLGLGDHSLPLHTPNTFAGCREAFAALLSGACLHVLDVRQTGLRHALDVLRSRDITLCATVPAMARALLAIDGAAEAFRRLRVMRLGGDTVLGSDIETLRPILPPSASILIGFGMGEAGGATFLRVIAPGESVESGRISVGAALPGQGITVEDDDGNPVLPGEEGVLVIRSRWLSATSPVVDWTPSRLRPIRATQRYGGFAATTSSCCAMTVAMCRSDAPTGR